MSKTYTLHEQSFFFAHVAIIRYLWLLEASNHMSKTNYRECWWLVKVMDGDLGPGSFRKGTGYTLRNLNDFRSIGSRIDWVTSHSYDTDVDEETRRSKDKFRQTVIPACADPSSCGTRTATPFRPS